jgi:hypothetical protein
MIEILKLAKKHDALSDHNSLCVFTHEELQDFADEYLALSSGEPVAYEVTYANGNVSLVDEENDIDPDNVELWGNYKLTPLVKANPLNTEMVETIKRLEEALLSSHNFLAVNYKQPYVSTPDYEDSDCWHKTKEALASISPAIKKHY